MADVVFLGQGPIVVDPSVTLVPGLPADPSAEVDQNGLTLPFQDVVFVRLFEGALLPPQSLLGPFVPPGPNFNTITQVPALLVPPEVDVRFERVAAPLRATIGFTPIVNDSGNVVGQRPIFIDGPLPDGFAGIQIYAFPPPETTFPQVQLSASRAVPNALGGPGNPEGESPGLFLSPELTPLGAPAPTASDFSFSNVAVAEVRPIPVTGGDFISEVVPNGGIGLHVRFLETSATVALRGVVRTIADIEVEPASGGDQINIIAFLDGPLPATPVAGTDFFVIETAPVVDLTPGDDVIL
jgi:hypothetical protein